MSEDQFPRRRDDIAITELAVKFGDFIDRYERDWKHTQAWRDAHYNEIQSMKKVIDEIAPNYRRGMLVLTTIALGSLTYALKTVLSHFSWR